MTIIYAKPGDKTIFVHPTNGYNHDRETAAQFLTVGQIYTVEQIDVHSWHTNVYLKEVPGVAFNSVMFDDVS